VLGHHHQFSIINTYNTLRFAYKDLSIIKSSVRQMPDGASKLCIAASQDYYGQRVQGVVVPHLVIRCTVVIYICIFCSWSHFLHCHVHTSIFSEPVFVVACDRGCTYCMHVSHYSLMMVQIKFFLPSQISRQDADPRKNISRYPSRCSRH